MQVSSLLKYSGGGRKSAVSADTANRRPACRVAPEHGLQARGPHALTGRRPVFHRRAWVFQPSVSLHFSHCWHGMRQGVAAPALHACEAGSVPVA